MNVDAPAMRRFADEMRASTGDDLGPMFFRDVRRLCDAYEAQAKLASHFADELVTLWHDAKEIHDESLAQFMGLTEEQYAAWVECRWEDVGV